MPSLSSKLRLLIGLVLHGKLSLALVGWCTLYYHLFMVRWIDLFFEEFWLVSVDFLIKIS